MPLMLKDYVDFEIKYFIGTHIASKVDKIKDSIEERNDKCNICMNHFIQTGSI